MRLEIYGEPEKAEPVLRLKLFRSHSGDISLHAVNEDGENVQVLLYIHRTGTITRCHLDADFIEKSGLDVDCRNCMRMC